MNKLLEVQAALKAPKNQFNRFGGYNYRSCEDILEAVKPLLKKAGLTMTLTDEIVHIGDWNYVRATATIFGDEAPVSVTAYAREEATKKGMDAAQITGSASSYARKYALNGLFLIDDSKLEATPDPDTQPRPDEKPKRVSSGAVSAVVCENCGRPVVDTQWNGRAVKAAEILERSQKQYGKDLCFACARNYGNKGH